MRRWCARRPTDRVIERNAAVQLCYVEVEEPDMHKPLGDLDRLKVALEKDWGWKDLLIAPHLIPQVQGILRKGNWGVTAAIHRDMDSSRPFIVGLWPGLKNEAYGIACDIGSTTIAMHLVSLLSGRIAASSGTSNPQIRFGEDLMSRVSYVMMNPDGREAMTKAVREAINGLIGKVCAEGEVIATTSSTCVFVGNPIMHHLFLGIDPTELGRRRSRSPFPARCNLGAPRSASRSTAARVSTCCPASPAMSAPTPRGATLSEGPYRQDEMMLLVDVGTNAEIVLGNKDARRRRLLAHRPGLRRCRNLLGQRAAPGAIERVRIDPETLEPKYRVIGVDKWSDEAGFCRAACSRPASPASAARRSSRWWPRCISPASFPKTALSTAAWRSPAHPAERPHLLLSAA
jgi:uncharacterized 2Fe-2S/4Fe-4S cluster protein (DUF4445 family)